ncbi:MAG: hypothetical protein ABUK01_06695 [Leptospirales bacterium]
MANAIFNENLRIKNGNYGMSPVDNINYSEYRNENHLENPISNSTDLQIKHIIDEYCESQSKLDIRRSITLDGIYTLFTYAKRSVVFSLRLKKTEFLQSAISSLMMIEVDRCDYRDLMVALAFTRYSAEILDFKLKEFIEIHEGDIDQSTNSYFDRFINKISPNVSLQDLAGYHPVEFNTGLGFVSTNYEKYFPDNPLHQILYDISNIICRDEYCGSSISIAGQVPRVWLSSENDKKFNSYSNDLNGCASMHAKLEKDMENILSIYILEFSNADSPELMLNGINTRASNRFARMIIVKKNILCIVVGRATVVGKKDYESNDTLQRFKKPILNVLDGI